MTVVFILCMSWDFNGNCLRAKTIEVPTEHWSDQPCSDLLPTDLLPLLLSCGKIRAADT